eukprot:COSAG01_NODE_14108_length_1495_cov_2.449140_3_plen_116_part_00
MPFGSFGVVDAGHFQQLHPRHRQPPVRSASGTRMQWLHADSSGELRYAAMMVAHGCGGYMPKSTDSHARTSGAGEPSTTMVACMARCAMMLSEKVTSAQLPSGVGFCRTCTDHSS